ncbi:MAG TPA: arylesterase [Acidobacteriaceae bacterium]|nr:arylesterase [Acidobacteriaceae bacterium]
MSRRFATAALLLSFPLSLYAAPRRPVPVIDCFGDSITAGYGVDPGKSYPDDLQNDLDLRGYTYRVVNSGISGNTTKDGIDRLKDVLALHPVVVIVEFGGNDGLRGIPIADTRRNLSTIVSTLLQAGSKVILAGITLPPNYGADYVQQFNQIFTAVAAENRVPVIPNIYLHVYAVPNAIQDDGIHPTAKGAQLVADEFLPLLKPLLHK